MLTDYFDFCPITLRKFVFAVMMITFLPKTSTGSL